MPEAVMLCVDTSEHTRNGDFLPTRLMAAQDAANLLVGAKSQTNPENTVGFLSMGGASVTIMETLTGDTDRVMATMTRLAPGGTLHFSNALQIAALALGYRANPRAEKRIIALVASPITEDQKALEKIAKKLRKDDVAVDIVAYGCEGNTTILEHFIDVVNKADNSRLLVVPTGSAVADMLYTSPILLGESAPGAGGGGGGGGGMHAAAGGFEFGVDPSADPELAMVLRMSAEEERRRLEQEAAGGQQQQPPAGGAGAPQTPGGPAAASSTGPPPVVRAPPPPAVPQQPEEENYDDMDEELAMVLRMSAEEERQRLAAQAQQAQQAQRAQAFDSAINDPAFMSQLDAQLGDDTAADANTGATDKKSKKEDDADDDNAATKPEEGDKQ